MTQQMSVQEWAKGVNDLMLTTEPLVNGSLGPKALTPDTVYRAMVQVRTKLAEAGVVLTTFQEVIAAQKQQLELHRQLVAQQHAMIIDLGGDPRADLPRTTAVAPERAPEPDGAVGVSGGQERGLAT